MPQSHDHNFKNLFLDFPKDALNWILPEAIQQWGDIQQIEFIRQEPKKAKLSDAHMALDMPILFTFKTKQVLLWLVEFQEDKQRFSIYKLLRYVSEYMEAYPDAIVIPTVLFTDRRKWKKDVKRELDTRFNNRLFLHFEYVLVKLFDLNAKDYYDIPNPLVKILLPKMNNAPEDQIEVLWHAYKGLYELVKPMLFDKYVDFIDQYAEEEEDIREELFKKLNDHKETFMIAKYIKDLGRQEGRQENAQEAILEALEIRFGSIPNQIKEKINEIKNLSVLKSFFKQSILVSSIEEFSKLLNQNHLMDAQS